MSRRYVHFDEREDVLASLELLVHILPLLKKNAQYWKWAIVSSHSALQGALVCFLTGTSGIEVLDERSAKQWRQWYETLEGPPPKERLAEFKLLLWRSCRKMKRDGQPLKVTRKELRDVLRLHRDFRNNFAHFTPKGWSIEKAGLPRILGTAVRFTGVLLSMDHMGYKLNGNQQRRLKKSIESIALLLPRTVAAKRLFESSPAGGAGS
jgi:hypothetical protein